MFSNRVFDLDASRGEYPLLQTRFDSGDLTSEVNVLHERLREYQRGEIKIDELGYTVLDLACILNAVESNPEGEIDNKEFVALNEDFFRIIKDNYSLRMFYEKYYSELKDSMKLGGDDFVFSIKEIGNLINLATYVDSNGVDLGSISVQLNRICSDWSKELFIPESYLVSVWLRNSAAITDPFFLKNIYSKSKMSAINMTFDHANNPRTGITVQRVVFLDLINACLSSNTSLSIKIFWKMVNKIKKMNPHTTEKLNISNFTDMLKMRARSSQNPRILDLIATALGELAEE